TETYSPAAIDIAPATRPASPATSVEARVLSAAATPTTSAAVETIPSLAPRTAARNQPMRCVKWRSAWTGRGIILGAGRRHGKKKHRTRPARASGRAWRYVQAAHLRR